MSKQKFQIGDRVIVKGKYQKLLRGVGTVVDIDRTVVGDDILIPADVHEPIHTPSTRKIYWVVFDGSGTSELFYSYELEKCGEPISPVAYLAEDPLPEDPIAFHTDLQPGHTEIIDTGGDIGAYTWVVDKPKFEANKNKIDVAMLNQHATRIKAWRDVCDDYLYEFCQRHGYHYDPFGWVGGDEGTIIEISDMFVTMDNIRYDVDNDINPDWFAKWYWKSVDVYELTGENYMNYENFCKGCPDVWTDERMKSIRESKKRIEDAKKKLEKEIENIKHNKNYF